MRAILNGCNGKMGKVVEQAISETGDIRIVAGADVAGEPSGRYPAYGSLDAIVEEADIVLDFSHPRSLDALLRFIMKRRLPAVIGTTGLSAGQLEEVALAARSVAVLQSANMSFGINMLIALVQQAAQLGRFGFDIEIVEKHHNQKVDAPSGTALMIANAINSVLDDGMNFRLGRDAGSGKRQPAEIGIHAVRGGTIVGEHEVIFAGPSETIEIKHTALSREVFAQGAIRAARFLVGRQPGLYSLRDVISGV